MYELIVYRIQHELEVTTKQAIFVDSSISDTIRTCIVLGNHRAAMKVRTEFKVSIVRLSGDASPFYANFFTSRWDRLAKAK